MLAMNMVTLPGSVKLMGFPKRQSMERCITRRDFVAGMAGLALAGGASRFLSAAAAGASTKPALTGKETTMPLLKDIYADCFMIGVALDDEKKLKDLQDVGPANFNAWTPENSLKWGPLRPEEHVYDFSRAERYLAEARKYGMKAHGHTLVWFQVPPQWLFADQPSRNALIERMERHIFTVGSHFRGRLHSWDVVNEAVGDEPGQMWRRRDHELYGVPRDMWLELLGEDYVEQAFRFAGQACPGSLLYYNEYFTVTPQDRTVSLAKGEKVCRLVRDLRDKGLRVDGVGIQGHWEMDRLDVGQVERLIEMLRKLDVVISISELDLGLGGKWDDKHPPMPSLPPELERRQAVAYAKLFRMFRSHRDAIERVTFWGVCDRNSWKRSMFDDYPLPFDTDAQPKEAFRAICDPEAYLQEHGQS